MSIRVAARGASTIAATAHTAADRVERDAVAAFGDEAGGIVLAAVDPPIDTGRLDASVHVVTTPEGFAIAAGGPQAPYAAIVNARQPFITPAFAEKESAIADTALSAVERVLDTIQGA